MRMILGLILICLIGCKDDKKVIAPVTAKVQEIADDLHTYQLPAKEPEYIPTEPTPDPEPVAVDIPFPDPRPLMREDQARQLRGLRQWKVNQGLKNNHHRTKEVSNPETADIQDPDYQQWEDATFAETRSTLPVDRSRILTADMRIPAILEDAVNSQIGGRLIAIVERDVLSPNGKYILLPAYSRMICHYEPLEEVGQSRLALQCHRLIRPDGVSIDLRESSGADQAGRNGLIGDVDQRLWERYGASFVLAGISALSQAGSNAIKNQPFSASANQFSQNIGQVTADVMEQSLNLAPILSIPAGSRIQVLPTTDIVLRHPQERQAGHKSSSSSISHNPKVQP